MAVGLVDMIRRSSLMKYGLLGILGGIGAIVWSVYAQTTMPERNQLQKVEGQMTEATKVTRKSRRSSSTTVNYQMKIRKADATVIEVNMPEREISEIQVRSLFGRPLVLEVDGESDVFAITAAGQAIVSYDNTRRIRAASNRDFINIGAAIAGVSILVFGLGWFLTRRRIAREMVAA